MFEDSLVESNGKIKTKSKYWMIGTTAFWVIVLAISVLIPLLYPEALPKNSLTATLTAPPPPPPPPPTPPPAVKVQPIKIVQAMDAMTVPKIPKEIKVVHEDAPPPQQIAGVAGMGMGASGGAGGGVPGGIMGNFTPPAPTVKVERPKGPARVSGGVMAGQILQKTQPSYPPIARAAHVSGAVVLHAIISKTGEIQGLTVVSGPEMLRAAAVDAVKQWRYKPYLLNGEPTEVDTTVTVNFNFGG